MIAKTKYFDEITYETEDIITITNGLFGFESFTKFLAIPFDSDNDSVLSLQSLEDPELSFILMNPFQLFEDYSPSPLSEDLKLFGDIPDSDLSYYVIAVLKDTIEASTLNLKAPLVVNALTHVGKQVILPQEEYKFRQPFPAKHHKED